MNSDDVVILAERIGKDFRLFNQPIDRLKQRIFGRFRQYGKTFCALSDISFSLTRGSVLGVIGDNGAGKSTLLQIVCGTITPSRGNLSIHGRIAALLELGAGFNPEFSGRENVFLNASVLGLTQEEIARRYDEIVSFSGIGEFIDQPVKTYSSGMLVRLAFSVATAIEPDVLVIDEALSVGDGAFARKSFDRIMDLKERGTTILFCSHSLYQVEAICDQVLWLEKGKQNLLGAPGLVIPAYRDQINQSEVKAIAIEQFAGRVEQPLLKGHGRLIRLELNIDDQPAAGKLVEAMRSKVSVFVDFQIDPLLPSPSIVYEIQTFAGITVSSGGTVFDGVSPQVNEGGFGSVRLDFPEIPLMRGKYKMTIYLGCERGLHLYEQATHALLFEVEQNRLELGVAFLPHKWIIS